MQNQKKFQFQYGTIKGPPSQYMTAGIWSFNSNMVRLKVQLLVAAFELHLRFNSNMVRLKEESPGVHVRTAQSFNSNMVRLKVPVHRQYCEPFLFQFQYGTIKGQHLPDCSQRSHQFQFQYGTIKGRILLPLSMTFAKFQFQYGTIKGTQLGTDPHAIFVSIPIWYD